ncbi:MAG: InlB B-repeat-containing protein [Candidatus Methanomethylophilaceae archaeon]|nr:InlB B-repeat-containing protein [Candidatus Methanomethylophilaceae archaeon]
MNKSTLTIVIAALVIVAVAVSAFVLLGGADKTVNHLEDSSTHITIDGEFPSGTSASVSTVSDQARSDILSKVSVDPATAIIYNIDAVKDGKLVQPNGGAKITVPVDFTENVSVYSVIGGAPTKIDSTLSNGKAVFKTGSLATFVIGTKPLPQYTVSVSTENMKVSVDGGAAVDSYSGTVKEGTKIILNASPNEGYMFTGYYVGGTLLSSDSRLEYTVKSDVAIKAVSETAKYDVKLSGENCVIYVNGKAVGGSFSDRVEVGTHIQAYAVAAKGYVITGWNGTIPSNDAICDFYVNGNTDVKVVASNTPKETHVITVKLVLSGEIADDYGSIVVISKQESKNVGTEYMINLESEGDPVSLSATTSTGYVFDSWTVEGQKYQTRNLSIRAGSDDLEVVGTVVPAPSHRMYVIANGGTAFIDGEQVTSKNIKEGVSALLSQTPSDGYRFIGWFQGDDCVSTSDYYNAIMGKSDAVYEARYSQTTHNVTLTAMNARIIVDGVEYGSSYQGTVYDGSELTFQAVPAEGFVFDSWTMNGVRYTGAKITVGGVSDDVAAVASVVPAPARSLLLSIDKGTVELDGKSLGASGSAEVREGQRVVVKAVPAYGYAFRGWTSGGMVVSTSAEYEFAVHGDTVLTAKTESTIRDVRIVAVNGGLIINSVNVGSEYETKLCLGEEFLVNAAPAKGYTFSSWDVNGKKYGTEYQSIKIVMGSSDILAVAYMTPMSKSTLEVFAMNGTVEVNDKNEGTSFSAKASVGDVYTIVAIPDNGYSFDHWVIDGEVSDYQKIKITMGTEYVSVNAVMKKNDTHRLTVSILDGNLYLDGKDMGPRIDAEIQDKQAVTLRAVPDDGYALAGWYEGGDIVTIGTEYQLQMEGDVSLVVKTQPAP